TYLIVRVHQRADGDVGVHVAVEADIAYRSAVNAAMVRLKLFDDLHGALFGRASDGAAGETVAQYMQRIASFSQFAFYRADQMMHVGETFHLKQFRRA